MRQLALVLLVACGGGAEPARDAPTPPIDMQPIDADTSNCAPATLFLVTDGGAYTFALNDDSRTNATSLVPQGGVTFDPYTAASLADARTCIAQRLQPFQITIADTDPGTAPHIEIVLSPKDATEIGMNANQPSITSLPGSCLVHAQNPVAIVWPKTVNDVAAETCDLVVQIPGLFANADYTSACGDAMAFNFFGPGCGGAFTDTAQPCQFGDCRCGGKTQNSFQRMISAYCPR